jgi:hypothetical protein
MNELWRPWTTQCWRKLRYDTETDAQMSNLELHGRRPEFNVYLCPHCEFWHVGHKIRPVTE